tara:strand:+ start:616 stop:753 length:138 start_codon:yes stop_codon:yes gene_type:complete
MQDPFVRQQDRGVHWRCSSKAHDQYITWFPADVLNLPETMYWHLL